MSIKRTGWASTDELERAIREERAREESMAARRLRKDRGAFGDYEVETGTGTARDVYRVELRSLGNSGNWCSCPDFIGKPRSKQGLADAVLDASANAADFGKADAGKAFMARVLELVDGSPASSPKPQPAEGAPDAISAAPKPAPDRTSAFLFLCREKLDNP